MDEEIERLVVSVRADTAGFARDVAAMQNSLDAQTALTWPYSAAIHNSALGSHIACQIPQRLIDGSTYIGMQENAVHHRMQKIVRRSFFAHAIVLQNSSGVVVQKTPINSKGVTNSGFTLGRALVGGGIGFDASNGNHLKATHCRGQKVVFRQNGSFRQVNNLASQHICFVPIKCHGGIIIQVAARPAHRARRRYLSMTACNVRAAQPQCTFMQGKPEKLTSFRSFWNETRFKAT